jgi:hypothetical protein
MVDGSPLDAQNGVPWLLFIDPESGGLVQQEILEDTGVVHSIGKPVCHATLVSEFATPVHCALPVAAIPMPAPTGGPDLSLIYFGVLPNTQDLTYDVFQTDPTLQVHDVRSLAAIDLAIGATGSGDELFVGSVTTLDDNGQPLFGVYATEDISPISGLPFTPSESSPSMARTSSPLRGNSASPSCRLGRSPWEVVETAGLLPTALGDPSQINQTEAWIRETRERKALKTKAQREPKRLVLTTAPGATAATARSILGPNAHGVACSCLGSCCGAAEAIESERPVADCLLELTAIAGTRSDMGRRRVAAHGSEAVRPVPLRAGDGAVAGAGARAPDGVGA